MVAGRAAGHQQILRVDLHGWKNGKRVTGAGSSGNKPKIVPGVTAPYTAGARMLPQPIPRLMAAASRLMKAVAYRV